MEEVVEVVDLESGRGDLLSLPRLEHPANPLKTPVTHPTTAGRSTFLTTFSILNLP